jgi:hypothetical protein
VGKTARPANEASTRKSRRRRQLPVVRRADFSNSTIRPSYEDAVREGKEIIAQIDACRDRLMRLGELADGIATNTSYGEGKLKNFARDVGVAHCTLKRCLSVFRAWKGKGAPAPPSYAVAQELQAIKPDRVRFEIIRENPNITKRQARAKRREHERAERTAPDWRRREAQRWFRRIVKLGNDAVREAATTDQPNDEAILREVIESDLLPVLRDGGEALIRLA